MTFRNALLFLEEEEDSNLNFNSSNQDDEIEPPNAPSRRRDINLTFLIYLNPNYQCYTRNNDAADVVKNLGEGKTEIEVYDRKDFE